MLTLTLKAELEGVTALRPIDTEENPYYFTFKVQCSSCRETHPNWVSFNRFEQNEIPGSRGEANFVWKCRLCTKTHSASIITAPKEYDAQAKKAEQKIIEMDCRGLEFIDFKADGEWEAKGTESSTPFTAIDLLEDEWYDYDEKSSEEVSIKEITWKISPHIFAVHDSKDSRPRPSRLSQERSSHVHFFPIYLPHPIVWPFDPSKFRQNTTTMSFQPVNPRPYLQARVGTEMIIRLKWGQTEYKGTLESIDSYMNVLLRDTEEYIDGKQTGSLGLVLIRDDFDETGVTDIVALDLFAQSGG
ncbi:hypothetical protein N7478_004589 [Penicillium angulare]|uniref:uncharacterized protein n=1 Tax=Penicillium angulare TaxID=116970 RepID=UPI0025418A52|nr:uncharacterized protein N7478_004589 [Penicillium angulare]KAJ5279217.1 hypothetical protein N7478_004589 [Penicillium angulare]